LGLAAFAGRAPEGQAGRERPTRPLAVLPVERLRARPAPLDAPESYLWSDRTRFRADLERHVADLHRQATVLRHGLRSGAGAAPRELLSAIREAEQDLVVQLARMGAATAQSWPGVRIDVLQATIQFGRAIERARRAASPANPAITI
jgi:hypothetical protein